MNTPPRAMNRRQALRLMFASTAAVLVAPSIFADDSELDTAVRQRQFNVNRSNLALDGYDPVSYHRRGGPRRGSASRGVRYKGIVYRFASDANKQAFLDDPAKYEPAYGGWCAWAMRSGDKTDVDPKNYLILNDRLHVFYKSWIGNTRTEWIDLAKRRGDAALIAEADRGWSRHTG